jgi:ubiquitin C-terminal hydrolase
MQCLVSLPELNYYFSNKLYEGKKSTPACNALREFIDTYNSAGSSLKACNSLYKICHSFLPANEQNDCQEFLRRFLSKIQEELNGNKKYTFPDKATFDKVWQIYKENNPSFIDTLFSGLMRSSVICNKCGYKSGI